jgi:hypothetical protein
MLDKISYVVHKMWVDDYYKLCCCLSYDYVTWQTASTTEAILIYSKQI